MEEKKLHKDRECIHCERFFECKGKPKEVDVCLQYKERRNGEDDNRTDND